MIKKGGVKVKNYLMILLGTNILLLLGMLGVSYAIHSFFNIEFFSVVIIAFILFISKIVFEIIIKHISTGAIKLFYFLKKQY